jgi:hypothetical protein
LTVLAAPAVDADAAEVSVAFRLTANACPRARYCDATSGGDLVPAVIAFVAAVTGRQQDPGAQDGIHYGIVDLILHGAIARPTICHPDLCIIMDLQSFR